MGRKLKGLREDVNLDHNRRYSRLEPFAGYCHTLTGLFSIRVLANQLGRNTFPTMQIKHTEINIAHPTLSQLRGKAKTNKHKGNTDRSGLSRAMALRNAVEARAQRGIAASNLLPRQYTRSQQSQTTAVVGGPRNLDDWQTGFDLSWELDVWGRLRRAIESSDAAVDAEIENHDNILVTLIGDVAASYIELRSLDERLRLARENVHSLQGTRRWLANSNLRTVHGYLSARHDGPTRFPEPTPSGYTCPRNDD